MLGRCGVVAVGERRERVYCSGRKRVAVAARRNQVIYVVAGARSALVGLAGLFWGFRFLEALGLTPQVSHS